MKKILYILFLLFVPFIVKAETCDLSKISISSIVVENTTQYVEELENATISDKSINVNLGMNKVGDSIRYKLEINNDSTEDFELDQTSLSLSTDYINYSFETDDGSKLIKAGSSKTVYLVVAYENEVPPETLAAGEYHDNKTLTVNLSAGDAISNPKTGVESHILALTLVLVLSTVAFLVLRKKGYTALIVIAGISIIIPITVNAVCKCELSLNSEVSISGGYTGFITRLSSTKLANGDTINPTKLVCGRSSDTVCSYVDENEFVGRESSVYIKHEVIDNVIVKSYICSRDNCLESNPDGDYESNLEIFYRITTCPDVSCNRFDGGIHSHGDYFYDDNSFYLQDGCGHCNSDPDGNTWCSGLDMSVC